MKTTPSIENPNYGIYYDSFQSIYFSDLCLYLYNNGYLDELGYSDCSSMLNGKLK